jgi:capsular exopolysaccharide synthesis family protein
MPATMVDPAAGPAKVDGMPSLSGGLLTASPVRRDNALQFNEILETCTHPTWRIDPAVNIFSESTGNPAAAEQFRTLRSRLYQLRGDQKLQSLLITSALPAEGKTFVTHNLGQAVVRQKERRALLIDADLRCSRLHMPLGAPTTPGLSDYLRGDADMLSVIQHGSEGNLCFIPGGTLVSDPSELLANGRLKTLLNRVASAFDWIVIDSPPCLPVADANILAEVCDGILLVVRAQSTPSAVVKKAGKELQGRNVLGVVMNGVEGEGFDYGSYYHTGYGHDAGNRTGA